MCRQVWLDIKRGTERGVQRYRSAGCCPGLAGLGFHRQQSLVVLRLHIAGGKPRQRGCLTGTRSNWKRMAWQLCQKGVFESWQRDSSSNWLEDGRHQSCSTGMRMLTMDLSIGPPVLSLRTTKPPALPVLPAALLGSSHLDPPGPPASVPPSPKTLQSSSRAGRNFTLENTGNFLILLSLKY